MTDDSEFLALEQALAADPENLELAWRYWHALGSWDGCDIRAGIYVHRAFRAAALSSVAGVLAFARAYRQLFELSGEGPRSLDPAMAKACEAVLPDLVGEEWSLVKWLLDAGPD